MIESGQGQAGGEVEFEYSGGDTWLGVTHVALCEIRALLAADWDVTL